MTTERLIQNGGRLLIIEHNLDLIRAADWVIDLGLESGSGGGRIVAQGTPEQVAECSHIQRSSWRRASSRDRTEQHILFA